MTAFLNLALLVIGTMATLAAFGGKTWRDGPERVLERVTARGWISLMCLVLAFAIGTIKEVMSQREAAISAASAAREKAEAGRKRAEQSLQLAESNSQLELARKSLEDLRKIDQITQDRLSDTKATLDDVRKNLASTRADLTQQSAANVVTSLANAGQDIKEMLLYMPLTAKARTSGKFDALLPSFDVSACRDLTGTELRISIDSFRYERIVHEAGDQGEEHDYFKESIQKADFIVPLTQQTANPILHLADQKSSNAYVYAVAINTLHHSVSAAQLYAALTKPRSQPFLISMSWPTLFKTRQAYDKALKTYPDILNSASSGPLPNENIEPHIPRPYPVACSSQVQQYFQAAFDKAALILILDQKENETIIFKLKALPPIMVDGRWSVSFIVSSTPIFVALDESFAKTWLDIWPKEPQPGGTPK